MPTFLEVVCKYGDCEINELPDLMNHPLFIAKLNDYFFNKKLRTMYRDRKGQRHVIRFYGFSQNNCRQQKAYEGYLGITVQQHFYIRHKIRLFYPHLRCVVEKGLNNHSKFFPPELLEIYEE